MQKLKGLFFFLDDILVVCALVCFVVASYMVNAVLGTYVLGTAFFVAAVFAGRALESLLPLQANKQSAPKFRIANKIKKRK